MTKDKKRGISLIWMNEKRWDYLHYTSGFAVNENSTGMSLVYVYVNMASSFDSPLDKVYNSFPKLRVGFNGIWRNLYVSYYFSGKVLIVTDVKQRITLAQIHDDYSGDNRRLFISNLFRNHILRHMIYEGYLVYHAAAIIEKHTNEVTLILGNSGTGKTTFALEAVKSKRFDFVAEDKVLLDPDNNRVIGSGNIHLKDNSIEYYQSYISGISLINGGTSEKKYGAFILPEYFRESGILSKVVVLNQNNLSEKSFVKRVTDFNDKRSLIELSQQGLYLGDEKDVYEHACNHLINTDFYEVYRKHEINFNVYCRNVLMV